MMPCTCGHSPEEHDHSRDPEYPGATSCTVEGCDCVAYQEDEPGSGYDGDSD
jgi:hypothetical protein